MLLNINTKPSYSIEFKQNLLQTDTLVNFCQNIAKQLVIISDESVASLYGHTLKVLLEKSGYPVHLFTFPPGEHFKTRETKAKLEDDMLAQHCMRDTCIIALGGGIVTDVAGFVAATYCRGIPVIYIPTTLLAMVDASIGGKTGVNTPKGKNLIGTFTQPSRVYIDVNFLDTLPEVEFNNGMVELIKHALIADKNLFKQIVETKITLNDKNYLQEMIYKSCDIKRIIVEQDPEEKNRRQLLNFGHTLGHAIEAASDYQIRHGEAVAIGMIMELQLAVQLNLFNAAMIPEIAQVLRSYSLAVELPATLKWADLTPYFKMDKKNVNQQVYCVLLEDIGKPHVVAGQYAHQIPLDVKVSSQ